MFNGFRDLYACGELVVKTILWCRNSSGYTNITNYIYVNEGYF